MHWRDHKTNLVHVVQTYDPNNRWWGHVDLQTTRRMLCGLEVRTNGNDFIEPVGLIAVPWTPVADEPTCFECIVKKDTGPTDAWYEDD